MAKQGYLPTYVWVVRYGGLAEDLRDKPITLVFSTRYEAVEGALPDIVAALKRKFGVEYWEADLIDQHNKTSFFMRRIDEYRDVAFVEAERVWFYTPSCSHKIPYVTEED